MATDFDSALEAIDSLLEEAQAEVDRLHRRVVTNAERRQLVKAAVPFPVASTAVEEQIALHAARAQVAALKAAWAAVARRERDGR